MYPVVILCGGLATRLRPLTESIPKSLIDVAGKPFLEHQLQALKDQGIDHVVLCVGHLGEQIREKIGDGGRFGLLIHYVADGPRLLGTGGALKRAEGLLGGPFFVLYGDSYLQASYREIAARFDSAGTLGLMTVYRNEGKWDTSNVVFRDGRILSYDKRNRLPGMQHIDYGLGVLKKEALQGVPSAQPYDLALLYQELVGKGELTGFEVFKRFYEIGTVQGLQETREFLSKHSGGRMEDYSTIHLKEAAKIIPLIDTGKIESMVRLIADVRSQEGRVFFLGVGGSAANAAHAVNDFRKLAGIESYSPTDNVSELTARTNDEGWETVFVEWLRGSRLSKKDMLFILSVGGGSLEPMVSPNLVRAVQYAKEVGARVIGIVGRDGGYTAKVADAAVIVPTVNPKTVTPHSEAFQAVIWHLIVSHPSLQMKATKWESVR
jgi:D-sedoheptulose 7-phosphate isomerase